MREDWIFFLRWKVWIIDGNVKSRQFLDDVLSFLILLLEEQCGAFFLIRVLSLKAGFINSLNNVKKAQAIDIVGQLLYSTTGSQALPLTACRRLLITEGCPRTQRFNNHWVYKLIVIKKYRESLKMLFRKIAVSQTKDFLYIRRYSKHWDYSIDIAITMQILYIIVL